MVRLSPLSSASLRSFHQFSLATIRCSVRFFPVLYFCKTAVSFFTCSAPMAAACGASIVLVSSICSSYRLLNISSGSLSMILGFTGTTGLMGRDMHIYRTSSAT